MRGRPDYAPLKMAVQRLTQAALRLLYNHEQEGMMLELGHNEVEI
ncbi:MAG: hypothetical protein ACRDFW_11485 [bacterium]